MRRDVLELDLGTAPHIDALELDLADVEAVRLMLAGGSVIDWHKAAFTRTDQVDRLLRQYHLDPDDTADLMRLRHLVREAIHYVETYLQLRIPSQMRDVDDLRDLFLWASDARGFRRTQVLSCMILKLMHVMQHLEAAELRAHAALPDSRLLDLANARITDAADRLRVSGLPIVAFYGSRKTRLAVITKLLCKAEDVANRIFDKLRYRIVVPRTADLVTALTWLTRELVPFPQVMPGQSHNNLLDPDWITGMLPPEARDEVQPLRDDTERVHIPKNEFSGDSYRMINVVVDLPVRLPPEALPAGLEPWRLRNVFVSVEFQLVDAATARANEQGDNAHAAYKRRQHERVRSRLTRGQYVNPADQDG